MRQRTVPHPSRWSEGRRVMASGELGAIPARGSRWGDLTGGPVIRPGPDPSRPCSRGWACSTWIEQRGGRTATSWTSAAPELGVKITGGVELHPLKAFRGDVGFLDVPGEVEGVIERWEKWRFPVQGGDPATRRAPAGSRSGRPAIAVRSGSLEMSSSSGPSPRPSFRDAPSRSPRSPPALTRGGHSPSRQGEPQGLDPILRAIAEKLFGDPRPPPRPSSRVRSRIRDGWRREAFLRIDTVRGPVYRPAARLRTRPGCCDMRDQAGGQREPAVGAPRCEPSSSSASTASWAHGARAQARGAQGDRLTTGRDARGARLRRARPDQREVPARVRIDLTGGRCRGGATTSCGRRARSSTSSRETTRETVNLGVLSGESVVYVDQVTGTTLDRERELGGPAHATAAPRPGRCSWPGRATRNANVCCGRRSRASRPARSPTCGSCARSSPRSCPRLRPDDGGARGGPERRRRARARHGR